MYLNLKYIIYEHIQFRILTVHSTNIYYIYAFKYTGEYLDKILKDVQESIFFEISFFKRIS